MAEQKTNNGNRNQPTISQRGGETERRSLARRESDPRALSRTRGLRPISMMRRMLDDLDVSPFGVGTFGAAPFSMMRRMFNDMERMFENFDVSDVDQGGLGMEWAPQIDVTRDGNNLIVRADVPGIPQDQIQIYAQDNALVIEGERKGAREDETGDVWRSERFYGRFRRVVPLPEGADPGGAVARYDNGVLEVTVQLPESSRGRRIQIQGSGQGTRQDQGQVQNAPNQSAPSQSGQSQKAERH